jgi:hypothetical protein
MTDFDKLADALKRLEKTFRLQQDINEIILDQSKTALRDFLVTQKDAILALNDTLITSTYERLAEKYGAGSPEWRDAQADFRDFQRKLLKLVYDSYVDINEGVISLKQLYRLADPFGIWGPKGWRPRGYNKEP